MILLCQIVHPFAANIVSLEIAVWLKRSSSKHGFAEADGAAYEWWSCTSVRRERAEITEKSFRLARTPTNVVEAEGEKSPDSYAVWREAVLQNFELTYRPTVTLRDPSRAGPKRTTWKYYVLE